MEQHGANTFACPGTMCLYTHTKYSRFNIISCFPPPTLYSYLRQALRAFWFLCLSWFEGDLSERMANFKGFRRIFGRVGFEKCLWKFHSRHHETPRIIFFWHHAALQCNLFNARRTRFKRVFYIMDYNIWSQKSPTYRPKNLFADFYLQSHKKIQLCVLCKPQDIKKQFPDMYDI